MEQPPPKVETSGFIFDVLERNWDLAKIAVTERDSGGKTLYIPMKDLKKFMAAYLRWHKKQLIDLHNDEQILGM